MASSPLPTGLRYNIGGQSLQLVHDGQGNYFAYDPTHTVNTRHVAFPGGLHGLGANAVDSGIQVAAQAANFIPVVGPIVSSILSIGDAIFGGGDPTALSVLINNIVQTRGAIADGQRALGINDTFTIPADFDPTDKGKKHPGFVDAIVEEALGVTEDQIQSNRRPDYYSAITALQKMLATVQSETHDAGLEASIVAALQPGVTQTQVPTGTTNPPVTLPTDTGILANTGQGTGNGQSLVAINNPAFTSDPSQPPVIYVLQNSDPNAPLTQDPVTPVSDASSLNPVDYWIIGGAAAIVLVLALRN